MKRLALLAALLAGTAGADIPPTDSAGCRGLKAGASCKTDGGAAGTCIGKMTTRPDYSEGPPPKYVQVETMICIVTAAPKKKSLGSLFPLAAGLAVLVLLVVQRRAGRAARLPTR